MKLEFHKYHGTGNDFILIDNRKGRIRLTQEQIMKLCDRHLGVGADGLMLLSSQSGYDFGMVYYNSDGKESTMCGNGGRCMVAFAHSLGLIRNRATFTAIDGEHTAEILDQTGPVTKVKLKMADVPLSNYQTAKIENRKSKIVINTGSPHLIVFIENVREIDVVTEGRRLRNDPQFAPDGTNVDFVEVKNDNLFVRTYERGVENETLSCGTGVTAAALAYSRFEAQRHEGMDAPVISHPGSGIQHPTSNIQHPTSTIKLETRGGHLTVSFLQQEGDFTDIWLEGPAEFVFSGEYLYELP